MPSCLLVSLSMQRIRLGIRRAARSVPVEPGSRLLTGFCRPRRKGWQRGRMKPRGPPLPPVTRGEESSYRASHSLGCTGAALLVRDGPDEKARGLAPSRAHAPSVRKNSRLSTGDTHAPETLGTECARVLPTRCQITIAAARTEAMVEDGRAQARLCLKPNRVR